MTEQQLLLHEDEQSRQRALDETVSFIVEAPAGAGKTELLTQRFLKLLQTVQQPEEIIAITFTNKAAAEMRLRILDSLNKAASNEPPAEPHKQITCQLAQLALQRAAKHDWNLLQNPSRLRIYTIDSLSSSLARQMPLMSRFGAQPNVSEDASMHYDEAAQRTLALLEDADAGEAVRAALRYLDNDAVRLTRLLTSMLAKRDQWLDYTQLGRHSVDASNAAENALLHMVTQDMAAAAAVLDVQLQNLLMPAARYAASNLPCEEPIALLRDWETPMQPKPAALPMWCALCELLLTGKGTLRKSVNVKQGFPNMPESKPFKDIISEVLDALQATAGAEATLARLRQLPQPKHGDEIWHIIAALAQLLNLAVAQLWLVFQEQGEVDFVEIAQRALQALEDEDGMATDLALRLDYRIQHLLVDEFQDTSPTQVKLLHSLTLGWTQGDGRTLFCVGDPMQSIYRFRKAEVGLFLRATKRGIGHVALSKLRLCRNNRSCPPLVDWVNQAFKQVFPAQDSIPQGAISYREFVATRNDEADVGVHVHALVVTDDETNDAARVREARQIIEIIRRESAQYPQRRIAVLVRARSHLQELVAEIRRHHRHDPALQFQAVEIEALSGRQIVQDLLTLTHALHHRADRVHWLATLRAPWCGLKLADLHALAAHDRYSTIWTLMHDEARIQAMSDDGRQRLAHVREIFDQAFAQQGRQSISRWVHGVWLMLGGAGCLWEEGDVRDVQAFFLRMEQLENTGQFSLERLANEVDQLYAAPDVAADGRLQFMTIHKSKGLEFDTVILPGLERRTGNNDQPLLLWEEVVLEEDDDGNFEQTELVVAPFIPKGGRSDDLPTAYDYLKLMEKERADNEGARVLYVAATRAERSLHLLGTAGLDAKTGAPKAPGSSFLSLLWPMLAGHFAVAAAQRRQTDEAQSVADIADFVPKLVRLAQPAIPAVLREYTMLKASDDVAKTTHDQDDTGAQSLDAAIGTLAHRYLELIAQQGIEQWTAARIAILKPAMMRWLTQRGYGNADAAQGASRVMAAMSKTLASADGQWVLQARPGAASELAVAAVAGGEINTHVVDRTFFEDGTRWVIDYKSARLDDDIGESALVQQAEYYRPQLERYAALFGDDGLPIKKAVFFLELGRLVGLA